MANNRPLPGSSSTYRAFYNEQHQNNDANAAASSSTEDNRGTAPDPLGLMIRSTYRELGLARTALTNDDIIWADFLRETNRTVPPERSPSADRKRRHVDSSSPERRSIPHRPAYMPRRTSGTMAGRNGGNDLFVGSSRDNAIDLTGTPSPPRQRPQMPQRVSGRETGEDHNVRPIPPWLRTSSNNNNNNLTGGFTGRQDSNDIVLPPWQPDGEVSRCPICRTEFSFWYRKHHCRKCGRVVCNACSPHRITIPKQYIVLPPGSADGQSGEASPNPRSLSGGEVVRVCNPCVPDPWTPPGALSGGEGRGMGDDQGARTQRPERYRNAVQMAPPPIHPPPFEPTRPGENALRRTSADFNRNNNGGTNTFFRSGYNAMPGLTPSNQTQPTNHTYRHAQSSWPAPMPHPAPPPSQSRPAHQHRANVPVPTAPSLTESHPPPQPTRREIPEEDECPVCGTELPSGEENRETHIQECIASRFAGSPSSSSAPPPPAATAPFAPPRTSSIASSLPHNPMQTPAAPTTTRPRASTYRPRGMAIYRATEKDCVSADGEAQECVICFEDFQPGEELGRMECLCKFHRACIRGWWDRRGGGSCPTHMLHE